MNQRLVVIFDSFERAADDLQGWVQNSFLVSACRVHDLIVIIAGRSTPQEEGEWTSYCHRQQLHGIEDVDAWRDYVLKLGVDLSQTKIETLYTALEGNPHRMAQIMRVMADRAKDSEPDK